MSKEYKHEYSCGIDNCYEEYCLTKCKAYKDIYMGSYECSKCKEFIKDNYPEYSITCRKKFIYI